MQKNEDASDNSTFNFTRGPVRFRPILTTRKPYYIPRRPRVIKFRDLSPETKERLTREYYDTYDPWTGIRVAATLGSIISLFTFFLIYKSKISKHKDKFFPSKKTSLYLYDDDVGGDLGSIGSSEHTSSYGYHYPYSKRNIEDRMMFPFQEGFQVEEVLVKNQVVECVALKVHRSSKRASAPKAGHNLDIHISEDASRSLPCSPYKPQQQDTKIKVPRSPTYSTDPTSITGSITSFGSTDTGVSVNKPSNILGKVSKEFEVKTIMPRRSSSGDKDSKTCPKSLVVTAKKPQDYRSRSTVVAIARRKRPS